MTQGGRPLTFDDFWDFKIVGDVQVSPAGHRAAHVVTTLDRERDEQRSAIWVVDLETREARQFTSGAKQDSQPRWSPDGRWLAFVSNRSGDRTQIYVMSAEGGEGRKITDQEQGAHAPTWAPDSFRIAFLVNEESDRLAVPSETEWVEAGTNGKDNKDNKRKDAPRLRRVTQLKYRGDGIGYYDTTAHLFVTDRDGSEPRQLTDDGFGESQPAWSPDGALIAFMSNRTPDEEFNAASDVWVVDVDSGEQRALTDGTLSASFPSWSPDGQTVAFYATPEWIANGTENTHLWAVSREGGDQRDLMRSFDNTMHSLLGDYAPYVASAPVWSGDGKTVYTTTSQRGSELLCSVPAKGGKVKTLLEGDVHVGSFQLSRDGKSIICAASTPSRPFGIYRIRIAGGELEELAQPNQDLLDEVELGRVESFAYPSVGGLEIQGWLVRPAKRTGKTPLVLAVHGGPHGMYGNTFYYNMHVLAGEGIASLYINPRGSAGYGLDFMRAVVASWGEEDFQDLMNGVDHAIEQGGIDPNRLGVTGGSYGGFMTNWVVGHTDRFAAGVAINCLSNLVSFYGTSDIGALWTHKQMGGPFWERWDWYVEHSPLTHVTRVNTPLLLLHAENDFRCPIEQSEQMFAALKSRRCEVELIRIPDASHGLAATAKPRHRIDRWKLARDWFTKCFERTRP